MVNWEEAVLGGVHLEEGSVLLCGMSSHADSDMSLLKKNSVRASFYMHILCTSSYLPCCSLWWGNRVPGSSDSLTSGGSYSTMTRLYMEETYRLER
jgi:hypothetical protein